MFPSNFLNKHYISELALFPSPGKEAPMLVDPLHRAIQSLGTTHAINLLSYAPENRPSARVIT